MYRKNKFRLGERVNGISVSGKRVLGEYRGLRSSYGAFVYGLEEGCTELKTYICLVLSLERPQVKHSRPGRPTKHNHNLKAEDPCTGITSTGLIISGFYMNSEGKYAWIRGWRETDSKFNLPEAFKVLTESLKKV